MTKRIDCRPGPTLQRVGAGGTVQTVRRILSWWDVADDGCREAGDVWYPLAREHAATVAQLADVTLPVAARAIAELSPRCRWEWNVRAAYVLAQGGTPSRVLPESVVVARRVLAGGEGRSELTAPKVHAFARNILGCRDSVTVDAWALRVAGVPEGAIGRVGVYAAVAHAYRLAARRANVTPCVMQAVTWCAIRQAPRSAWREEKVAS
jgi:hypothetical protein